MMSHISRFIRYMRISAIARAYIRTKPSISMSSLLRKPWPSEPIKTTRIGSAMSRWKSFRPSDRELFQIPSCLISSRGRFLLSLIFGCSGNNSRSNMQRLHSRRTFWQSTIAIRRNCSSHERKEISGIQKCCLLLLLRCLLSSTRIQSRSGTHRISRPSSAKLVLKVSFHAQSWLWRDVYLNQRYPPSSLGD